MFSKISAPEQSEQFFVPFSIDTAVASSARAVTSGTHTAKPPQSLLSYRTAAAATIAALHYKPLQNSRIPQIRKRLKYFLSQLQRSPARRAKTTIRSGTTACRVAVFIGLSVGYFQSYKLCKVSRNCHSSVVKQLNDYNLITHAATTASGATSCPYELEDDWGFECAAAARDLDALYWLLSET
jgi:hypothetical protein